MKKKGEFLNGKNRRPRELTLRGFGQSGRFRFRFGRGLNPCPKVRLLATLLSVGALSPELPGFGAGYHEPTCLRQINPPFGKPANGADQYPSTFRVTMKDKALELTSIPYSLSLGFPHDR